MGMAANETVSGVDIEEVLRDRFGFDGFRAGQEAVMTRLVAGQSVLAVFPTGAGKSMCYQLPALMLDGLTVVISPLIALMKDQIDFLTARGLPAARLDSSLDREETLQLYDDLRGGRLKLLYISPERLGNERFLQTLGRQRISLLAIDEAHCISQWGHNFRPDYLKIARLAKELEVERVLALTATATPAVARDITKAFDIAEGDVVHTGFYRPNLTLRVTPCRGRERDDVLLQRVQERAPGPTIVYVTLQKTAEHVAAKLSAEGLNAMAYHAGMKPEERNRVQTAFMASDHAIIVATIAFGMGVDKKDIRYIYHYNLPKGLESYSQEIGRAGRDGKPSTCEMLAVADDVPVLENFSHGDTPDRESVEGLINQLLGQDDVFDISVYDLSARFDVRKLVVKTLLTYLELKNVIESTGPFYSEYKFKPQRSSEAIFERVGDERADFLRRMFRHAKKGSLWLTLDADTTAKAIGEPRERIVKALGYLEEVGDIELKVAGVREGYRVRERPQDVGALCESLYARVEDREAKDTERVRQVVAFAEHDGCLTQHLLKYFGEEHEPCGHCDRCEGKAAKKLPRSSGDITPEIPWVRLEQLAAKSDRALRTPRQRARFLCGITSPATTRAKLTKDTLFGECEGVPFRKVLTMVRGRDHGER